jgi:parallel beta-helix repeat protein
MKSTSAWVLASCLLVACGGDDTTGGGAGTASPGSGGTSSTGSSGTSGSGGTSSTGAGGANGGGAGTSATGGSGGNGGAAGSLGAAGTVGGDGGPQLPADDTMCGMVMLAANKIIPAGKITAVCPGAMISASMGVNITVQGTLRVDGTAAMPAIFQGAAHGSQGWAGIVIASGGVLQMSYGEIHDALLPIDAQAKSDFQVDHVVIDNSRSMAHLASNGTINHGVMHGLATAQTLDPITVDSASPHILNTSIDRGGGKDYITVNGATSAAVFDHLDLTGAHCAFHFNGGNGITISNSNIHTNLYGLMVEGSTNNKITHNNFSGNTPAIGDCGNGGSATVTDNFFMGPTTTVFGGNPTCNTKLTSTTPAAAAYPLTGAGAVGPQP